MFKAWLEHIGDVRRHEVLGKRVRARAWPTMERRDAANRRGLVDRIRGEFLEMRGVALTADETSRLMGVPRAVCSRILDGLISEGSLRLTQDGRYMRPESAP